MKTTAMGTSLFLLLWAGGAALGPRPQDAAPAAAPLPQRTVVLVRHAEKEAGGDASDPALSGAGEARAQRLAALLAKAGVTRLVASPYRRTRATLEPLARACGLDVETRPAAPRALAQELAQAPPGSVTVVAGHSNTLPALAAALGVRLTGLAAEDSELGENEYDRLVVITLPPAGAPVRPACLELRYTP